MGWKGLQSLTVELVHRRWRKTMVLNTNWDYLLLYPACEGEDILNNAKKETMKSYLYNLVPRALILYVNLIIASALESATPYPSDSSGRAKGAI